MKKKKIQTQTVLTLLLDANLKNRTSPHAYLVGGVRLFTRL